MKKLFAIIPFLIIFWGCPQMEYDLDKESPYIDTITVGSTLLQKSRDKNVSFDNIDPQNTNIETDQPIIISFSEDMYIPSLFQYGDSETVVLVKEDNYSRTLFNGIENPPLSDSNYAKIEKDLTYSKYSTIGVQISFEERTLEKNTKYALIISKSVVDKNGKALGVDYIENNITIYKNENFILFFQTAP